MTVAMAARQAQACARDTDFVDAAAACPPWSADGMSAVARMSHELRNPLTALLGFAELIHSEAFGALGNERYREYAGYIRCSGARLLEITEATVERARSLPLPVTADLAAIVEAVLAEAPSIRPLGEVPPGTLVRVDGHALQQALVEIAGVARALAGPGCTIELASSLQPGRVDVTISVRCEGSEARELDGGRQLTVAGTLLRLQGLALEHRHTTGSWVATVAIPRAALG